MPRPNVSFGNEPTFWLTSCSIWRSFSIPALFLLGGEVGNHPRLLQEVEELLKGSEYPIVRVGLGALGSSAVLWGAIQRRSTQLFSDCCSHPIRQFLRH